MKTKYKKSVIVSAAAGMGMVIGFAGNSSAQTTTTPTNPAAATPAATPEQKSTEAADATETAGTESAGDASETAALIDKAKVSEADARAAALKASPGTVKISELQDEDGKIVWGVEITTASGSVADIKVDGTTGVVVSTQSDTNEAADAGNESANG